MVSWLALMGLLTAAPLLQILAFGYLLRVSGHLAAGGKLRNCIEHLDRAGKIGLAVCIVFLAAAPSQLFAHYESLASIVNPGSQNAATMRQLAIFSAAIAFLYLVWAWARGGELWQYVWPQPRRAIAEIWRPSFWNSAIDRLWELIVSLQIPSTFWLGARGVLGSLVWLLPAVVVMMAFRRGETGLAGLIGLLAIFALAISIGFLPMLQVNFAASGRTRDLFAVQTVRRRFRYAPWSYLTAMVTGLIVFPIPLYLLKIEATPREVVWLPCIVFVTFMLPARIAEGLAMRRAADWNASENIRVDRGPDWDGSSPGVHCC